MTIRILKALMVATGGLWTLLIAVDNVIDYDSKGQFIRHVLSMDTVIPDTTTADLPAAIDGPAHQQATSSSSRINRTGTAAICRGFWPGPATCAFNPVLPI